MMQKLTILRAVDKAVGRRFVQTATKQISSFEEEWKNAKPFESIPRMGKLALMKAFLPGGSYQNDSIRVFFVIFEYNYFFREISQFTSVGHAQENSK